MKQLPSIEELFNPTEYELIEEVEYEDLKSFLLNEISQKSFIIKLYGFFQIIAIIGLIAIFSFLGFGFHSEGNFKPELTMAAFALLFSVTLLIPLHELIHAAAFLVLGKKDINFGVQLKKFIFYTESNRQVLTRREMNTVALAPFVVVLIGGMALFLLGSSTVTSLPWLIMVLTHFLFCGGDFAIVSFFSRYRHAEVYTFDDRELKRSYYFRKKNIF